MLGETAEPDIAGGLESIVSLVDELLDVDPSDSRYMFWEGMKRMFLSTREIEPKDLDDRDDRGFPQGGGLGLERSSRGLKRKGGDESGTHKEGDRIARQLNN